MAFSFLGFCQKIFLLVFSVPTSDSSRAPWLTYLSHIYEEPSLLALFLNVFCPTLVTSWENGVFASHCGYSGECRQVRFLLPGSLHRHEMRLMINKQDGFRQLQKIEENKSDLCEEMTLTLRHVWNERACQKKSGKQALEQRRQQV